MGKNNNKLLSLFLLTSIVTTTSIFSGILSISKERYERSEAAGSYKVVYLSVPNQVVDNSGNNPKTWDKDNDLHVNEFGGKDGIYDAGDEMSRVDTNLYAYVLNSVYSSTSFILLHMLMVFFLEVWI